MNDLNVFDFSTIIHISVSLLTALFLIYIWYYNLKFSKERILKKSPDLGLIFLSLALTIWGFAGICRLVFNFQGIQIKLLSSLNNGLFLLAIPYFEHGFKFFKNKQIKKRWNISVIIVAFTALLLIGLDVHYNQLISTLIDSVFSIITLLVLGFSLFLTFQKRNLLWVAILTVFVISLQLFPTVGYLMNPFEIDLKFPLVLYLVSSIALNILFIALAFSWLLESQENNINNLFSLSNDNIQEHILTNKFSFEEIKSTLLNQLISDEIEEVVEELISFFKATNNSAGTSKVIQIAAKLSRNNTLKIREEIEGAVYYKRRNEIRKSIIELMQNEFYPPEKVKTNNG
ncbi:MAG: hypothetical protein ACKV1O_21540 [Saprospiraceae bacterium]